ncbi:MAG: SUMF1/EgtB/PvdO family nonheme iron enzyme [Gemmataceae bacterium]
MPVPTTANLVEELRTLQILQPEQAAEISKLAAPDTRTLCRELMQRGHITAYQANLVGQGKAKELVLGSYIILDRLGEGGMGQVFKARHVRLDRIVALKVIRKERLSKPEAIRRFQREAKAAGRLSHPNIVAVHDSGEINGTHFLAMELVDGIDMARLVKKSGPLPVQHACHYMRQAALGLQHAHERGLTHRDIKPHNLLVTSEGKVKVLDMGLARLESLSGSDEESKDSGLTKDGSVIGTPDYLAPEQAKDARNVDIRSDLYSLGCTFYYLLTGKRPFVAESLTETLLKHQLEEAVPVRKLRNEVPAPVEAIVAKLMRKKPEERYQKPDELAADLEQFLRGKSTSALKKGPNAPVGWNASEPGTGSSSASRVKSVVRAATSSKRRMLISGGALFLFVLIVYAMLPTSGPRDEPEPVANAKNPPSKDKDTRKDKDKQPDPPAGLPREVTNKLGMKMMLIPAGSFQMGSAKGEVGRLADEGPQHKVTLSKPFYMGSHEVTVGEFRKFADAARFRTQAEREGGAVRWTPGRKDSDPPDPKCNWRNPGYNQTDDDPVVCVSWNDVQAFCRWMTDQEGKTYRLPTEAEWEYACRGGTSTPYSFGSTCTSTDINCNGAYPYGVGTKGPNRQRPVRVGTFKANDFGLFDMHGNVWEWCGDFYEKEYYGKSPSTDPQGPLSSDFRVVRGGSWAEGAVSSRSAARGPGPPGYRDNRAGFRVVLEAD